MAVSSSHEQTLHGYCPQGATYTVHEQGHMCVCQECALTHFMHEPCCLCSPRAHSLPCQGHTQAAPCGCKSILGGHLHGQWVMQRCMVRSWANPQNKHAWCCLCMLSVDGAWCCLCMHSVDCAWCCLCMHSVDCADAL